jgi:hypothetical protein
VSAPRAAVSVLHWAQGALRERRARRAIARIVPFSRLSEADRSELIVSRRRVLQGVEHVHRSSTAAPEVQHLRTEDLHLTVLRDVLVDVHHGFALTRSGLILEDTAIARGPIERKLHSGKLLRPTRVVPVDRPVMCLECGPKNANFFHFWFESMTKLLWVREEEVARLGPSILAHSRTLAPWQRSLLDAAHRNVAAHQRWNRDLRHLSQSLGLSGADLEAGLYGCDPHQAVAEAAAAEVAAGPCGTAGREVA